MGSGGSDLRRLTVLQVEDDAVYRELTMILLEAAGCTMIQAGTAEEGIRLAREKPVDLILMDVNLPGMGGFSAARVLRDDPRTKHVPVVALTSGDVPDEEQQRARAAGFDAYLTKPIEGHALEALVRKFSRSADGC